MKSELKKTFRSLFSSHEVIEIRAKRHGKMRGWFFGKGSGSKIIELVERLNQDSDAIYITLNPVSADLLTSHPHTDDGHSSHLTTDSDIARRSYILIDVDPIRPANVSSTDAEKQQALDVIQRVKEFLQSAGLPQPFEADSGNGYHLLLPCNIENTPEATDLVKAFLKLLDSKFSTDEAKVDTVVSNAARIVKLYGTTSRKGESTKERPHRGSQLTSVPDTVEYATANQIAAILPAPEPVERKTRANPAPVAASASPNRKYVLSALDSAIQKVQSAPAGQRNDTLNSEAFCIAQFVGGGELSESLAWSSLSEAAELNGLAPNEIDSTLHSAFTKGKSQPRYAPEVRKRPEPAPQPPVHDNEMVDPETGEITERQTQAQVSDEMWADFNTNWVYVEATKMFIHLKTMRQLTTDAFNMTHAALLFTYAPETGKRPNAAMYLMKDRGNAAVHNTMYLPAMWNGDPIFEIDGIRYLNTYNDIWTPKADANWDRHDAWQICLSHLQTILPDDWRDVLMFMAHNVQYPGKKILWAPIIVGIQGDGKTVLAKIMAAAMGAKNTKVVGLQATRSEFNSWAEGSCLAVFEEIRAPGHSRHDFMNKLKELITNDVIDVVAKGRDGRNVVNTQNYMALSNFRDALAIDEHDRRWGVFFTRFKDRAEVLAHFGQEYWAKLNDYAIKGHPEVIRGWLMSIDLTGFDRNSGPKMTEAKKAMSRDSMSEDVQSVQEAIEIGGEGVSHRAVSTRRLSAILMDLERTSIKTSRLSKAMITLKYRNAGVVKWNRGTHRVWVHEDVDVPAGQAGMETLRQLLDETL